MLDAQRYRGARYLEEIRHTRRWMWAHMILGVAAAAVFLFHGVLRWSAGAAVWHGVGLALMYGFMTGQQICRVLLGLVALGGAGAGLFFINRVFPLIEPSRMNLIPHAAVSVLVGLVSITYAVIAMVLLFDQRIRKAGSVGFSLW